MGKLFGGGGLACNRRMAVQVASVWMCSGESSGEDVSSADTSGTIYPRSCDEQCDTSSDGTSEDSSPRPTQNCTSYSQHILEQVVLFCSTLPLAFYCILNVHPEVCWCALQRKIFLNVFGLDTLGGGGSQPKLALPPSNTSLPPRPLEMTEYEAGQRRHGRHAQEQKQLSPLENTFARWIGTSDVDNF